MRCFPLLVIALFTLLLPSCKPDNVQTDGSLKYFDIKGYFKADTARLRKLGHNISKTVVHNGVSETKNVKITNWGAELNLFAQSDINKPAWNESYTIQSSDGTTIYTAKYPDLKTRKIVINKQGDKLKWILIFNRTTNMLYESTEKLSYFPDSVYDIQKYQKVRFLGANRYSIKGSLN